MLTPVPTPADHEAARITAHCRALTPQTVAALTEIALDNRVPRTVRLDACDTLLAYAEPGLPLATILSANGVADVLRRLVAQLRPVDHADGDPPRAA